MNSLALDLNPVIFLGTADGAIQDHAKCRDTLKIEWAVLSVLGYRATIGTPFLWQSPATLDAFGSSRQLFESPGGPLLTGRAETPTVAEYFYRRQHDTQGVRDLSLAPNSPFKTEHPGAVPIDWQREIAPSTSIAPRNGSVETEFKTLFLQDTSITSSAASIFHLTQGSHAAAYSAVGRNRADSVLCRTAETVFHQHFSRAAVEDSLLRSGLDGDLRQPLLRRTSALYQAANGKAHSGVLFTTPDIAHQLRSIHDLLVVSRWSVSPMNPYLFVELLRPLGVSPAAWAAADTVNLAAAVNTQNPLRMFADIYKGYLNVKLFDWSRRKVFVPFGHALQDLTKALLRNDDWRRLEAVAPLSGRKFDSLFAGVAGGAVGLAMGANPFTVGGATRQVVEFGYKFLDGFSLFEVLGMRRTLRRYLKEIGLIS